MSSSQRTGNARSPCRAPPGPGPGVLCSATTPPRSSDAIVLLVPREKTVKSATPVVYAADPNTEGCLVSSSPRVLGIEL